MKKFLLFFLIFLIGFLNSISAQQKILMIVAKNGFRDEELFVTKEILEGNGYDIEIASSSKGPCYGMLGHKTEAMLTLDEINISDYQAIIFVGGVGAREFWDNPLAHRIAQEAEKENKIIAGICIAPVILARAGILKGKRATVWPGVKRELQDSKALYTARGVERDGNIITADGPGSSEGFGYKILEALKEGNR